MSAILGHTDTGPVELDLDRLIGSHMGIVANAGGGKSGFIRKLLEQTYGQVQHIILDSEDEFYTLREKHDYVIAGGDGGDTPAPVESAAALARTALEHGFSLICQLNDLGREGAGTFIEDFIAAMLAVPRQHWRPCLVVIDEVHRFDPVAIGRLSAEGRKRGFTAVFATQRLPKLDANIRGDLNNWVMGRVGQSLDRNHMADQLGMSKRAGAEELARMEPRQFYAFGPALSRDPVLFHVGDVETTMVRPGQAKVATPPAPEALREILAGLAMKPSEPEGDADPISIRDRAKIDCLQARVTELEAQADEWSVEMAYGQQQLNAVIAERDELRRLIGSFHDDTTRVKIALDGEPRPEPPSQPKPAASSWQSEGASSAERPARETAGVTAGETATDIPKPQQRVLDAIAWWAAFGISAPSVEQVAFIAGYSPGSGGFNNLRGKLRSAGLIDYPSGGAVALTDEGSSWAYGPQTPPTRAKFHSAIQDKLSDPQWRMIEPLIDAYPGALTVEELADKAGYSAGSGGFNNLRGKLRTLGLIDYPGRGQVRLEDWMMP